MQIYLPNIFWQMYCCDILWQKVLLRMCPGGCQSPAITWGALGLPFPAPKTPLHLAPKTPQAPKTPLHQVGFKRPQRTLRDAKNGKYGRYIICTICFQGSANFRAMHSNRNRNYEPCAVWHSGHITVLIVELS